MTHRSDRIPLAHDEPRCEPGTCTVKHRCARYLAELPRGGSISDFSRQDLVTGGTALCDWYIDLSALKVATKPPPPPKKWAGDE